MKAVNNKLLIFPDPIKETSAGGIELPEIAKEKTKSGTIHLSSNSEYPPGSRVWFPSYFVDVEIELVGPNGPVKYLVIPEKEIWLIE